MNNTFSLHKEKRINTCCLHVTLQECVFILGFIHNLVIGFAFKVLNTYFFMKDASSYLYGLVKHRLQNTCRDASPKSKFVCILLSPLHSEKSELK